MHSLITAGVYGSRGDEKSIKSVLNELDSVKIDNSFKENYEGD